MRQVREVRFIEATPGEHIEDVAREARRMGVACFLHNGKLYRVVADYRQIAEVEPDDLRRAASLVGRL